LLLVGLGSELGDHLIDKFFVSICDLGVASPGCQLAQSRGAISAPEGEARTRRKAPHSQSGLISVTLAARPRKDVTPSISTPGGLGRWQMRRYNEAAKADAGERISPHHMQGVARISEELEIHVETL